jgi:hypothetical protein
MALHIFKMGSSKKNTSLFLLVATRSTATGMGVHYPMTKRSTEQTGKPGGKDVAEELDTLNARTRQRGSGRVRRKMEATIEANARKRRGREAPASDEWKRY